MDETERAEVLKVLSDIQNNGASFSVMGTASLTVQIGGTAENGMVEYDSLYIKNAPSLVINELTDRGYSLSVTDEGVRVR